MAVLLPVVALAAFLAPAPPQAQASQFGPTSEITEARLRAHLTLVAHDLLEGRDTPSRGLDLAALYISTQLKLWGVEPAGENGTYFQTFPLVRRSLDASKTTFELDGQKIQLAEGFYPRGSSTGTASGQVVTVKSGWANKSKGIDPFAGLDVKGKVVVTDGGRPEGVTFRDTSSPEWLDPQAAAAAAGATGVIFVRETATAESWKRQLDRATQAGRFSMESDQPVAQIPAIEVGSDVAQQLNRVSASVGDIPSAPTVAFSVSFKQERTTTQNVVAKIPGSDPSMAGEYVALGSHYDHVGIGRADASGDTIYNGADDDGSGTVALLEIAHAMMVGPRPKRSTLFVWHAGEEKGMWGSEYYCANPTVDLKKVVIQINIDMIGRGRMEGDTTPANARLTGMDEIYLIGPKIVSSDIEKMCTAVNKSFLNMKFNDYHDKLEDPARIYFRSDHASYVAKGVPAVFFFDGEHVDYHRPSDHADKIDYRKYMRTTQTIMATAYAFGNSPTRPRIDGPITKTGIIGG